MTIPLLDRYLWRHLRDLFAFGVASFTMAMLLASLLAIGRLSDGQEITAMRTSGISLTRIALSIVAAGVLVSVLTLALNEGVAPRADERYRRAFAIALQGPSPTERRDVLFREVQGNIESVYFILRLLTDAGRMDCGVVHQYEEGELQRHR